MLRRTLYPKIIGVMKGMGHGSESQGWPQQSMEWVFGCFLLVFYKVGMLEVIVNVELVENAK